MNTEQQRIAIAEACGFADIMLPMGFHQQLSDEKSKQCGGRWRFEIPDYLNDLNAMHEAEKTLDDDHLYIYGNKLDRVTLPKTRMEMCYVHGPEAGMYPDLFRATAAQRAEAFLKTIDKWTTNTNND